MPLPEQSHLERSDKVARARPLFHQGKFPKGGLKAACEACGCSYKSARTAEKENRPLDQSVKKRGQKCKLPGDFERKLAEWTINRAKARRLVGREEIVEEINAYIDWAGMCPVDCCMAPECAEGTAIVS